MRNTPFCQHRMCASLLNTFSFLSTQFFLCSIRLTNLFIEMYETMEFIEMTKTMEKICLILILWDARDVLFISETTRINAIEVMGAISGFVRKSNDDIKYLKLIVESADFARTKMAFLVEYRESIEQNVHGVLSFVHKQKPKTNNGDDSDLV